MKFEPHDYQSFAIDYIEKNPISALLLDMGLGKTVIALTAIQELMHDSFEVRKVLVVAPLRVARDTWPNEIRKWEHLKDITYSVAIGTEAERLAALAAKADIYIINRENVDWLVRNCDFDFDMVIVDELSSFKNPRAKRFLSLMKVRPRVKRIVGLTGTPSGNGLMDLFAEFKLLDLGKRLGRFISRYRNEYFIAGRRNGMIVYNYIPLPDAEELIYQKISDITISMKSTDYIKMPELLSTRYDVFMDSIESEDYENLEKKFVLDLPEGEITAANAGALTTKLSQLANGAVYDDEHDMIEFHGRKLDALEDIIEAANGKPLLVAYWFQHDLERIKRRFDVREIKSSKDIEDWNNKKIPVAVIHPASAGHGLNLQAGGSTLVWFGLTWSLELYQQTNARLWRQGQTDGTVVIQHIITAGTIDERVLKALEEKNMTQAALIAAVKADIGGRKC